MHGAYDLESQTGCQERKMMTVAMVTLFMYIIINEEPFCRVTYLVNICTYEQCNIC